eukprot:1420751-Prorocentrum_lima.AAC.1
MTWVGMTVGLEEAAKGGEVRIRGYTKFAFQCCNSSPHPVHSIITSIKPDIKLLIHTLEHLNQ